MSNLEMSALLELIKLKNEKPEEYQKLLTDLEAVMHDMMVVLEKQRGN